ncbi:MAG: hypothetical protein V9E99_14210 [Microthrixaceae bacterium]|jgi:hypothetical protein|nr:hypothetical protein [Actinomycetota bacterium]HMS14628.1 hypothetical protein [Microthrixaceae bacterium]HMT26535.1 hypothetical protein [Microthrixaceae bacterium]HMT62435.1 hypothetical protein [Microthrixaceae bacterium]
MSTAADLASVASSLELMIERVSGSADAWVGGPNEDLSLALMDVERSLRSAQRRLERIVRDISAR